MNRSLAALALALTANALSVTNVFPYSPYMPKFFGLTADDRELGFYAGFFMTAYMVGSGASALLWGVAADRYGKKAVILFSLLSATAPQVLFGMATSMQAALALRLIMGLLNGLVGAAKALAPELVPPSEQASAMSMIAATWGLGNLLGPAIGGLLSRYHLCESAAGEGGGVGESASGGEGGGGKGSVEIGGEGGGEGKGEGGAAGGGGGGGGGCPTYPFLLPNVVCAALAALALVAVYFFLPNDRRRAVQPPRPRAFAGAPRPRPWPLRQVAAESDRESDREALRAGGAAAASDQSDEPAEEAPQPAPRRRSLSRQAMALIAFYFLVAMASIEP